MEDTPLLRVDCLVTGFLNSLPFFLSRHEELLHLSTPINDCRDLRLQDFSLRFGLRFLCFNQTVRVILAARHAAYHFEKWIERKQGANIVQFAIHSFGVGANLSEVGEMVRNGQKLTEIEHQCQNIYIQFWIAQDWDRFQATPTSDLLRISNDFLKLGLVKNILRILPQRFPVTSHFDYHGTIAFTKQC